MLCCIESAEVKRNTVERIKLELNYQAATGLNKLSILKSRISILIGLVT
jgi:hypothetical protein